MICETEISGAPQSGKSTQLRVIAQFMRTQRLHPIIVMPTKKRASWNRARYPDLDFVDPDGLLEKMRACGCRAVLIDDSEACPAIVFELARRFLAPIPMAFIVSTRTKR